MNPSVTLSTYLFAHIHTPLLLPLSPSVLVHKHSLYVQFALHLLSEFTVLKIDDLKGQNWFRMDLECC